MPWTQVGAIAGLVSTSLALLGILGRWLMNERSRVKKELQEKLDAHEKLDAIRFENLQNTMDEVKKMLENQAEDIKRLLSRRQLGARKK